MNEEEDELEIEFDTWVAVAAASLDRDLEARDLLLEEKQIEPDVWERAELHWNRALAADIARADLSRAKRFAEACRLELLRRAAAPKLEETLPVGHRIVAALPFHEAEVTSKIAKSTALPTDVGFGGDTLLPEMALLGRAITPFDVMDPKLTVESYAALSAEVALAPDETEAIVRRYGLFDVEAFRALQSKWQERFDKDRGLRAQWLELYAAFSSRNRSTP